MAKKCLNLARYICFSIKMYYNKVVFQGHLFNKHRENYKTLPREHLIGSQGVKMSLLKDHLKYFCHKLIFVIIHVLSQLVFEFCNNLSFWVLLQFEFLSLVTIWALQQSFVTISVFEFCHYFNFWVSSPFEFLSFVTIGVFEFDYNLSFWVPSQFEFFFFISVGVLDFHHNLNFWVLSQFEVFIIIKI